MFCWGLEVDGEVESDDEVEVDEDGELVVELNDWPSGFIALRYDDKLFGSCCWDGIALEPCPKTPWKLKVVLNTFVLRFICELTRKLGKFT